MYKRKHRKSVPDHWEQSASTSHSTASAVDISVSPAFNSALFIQAHEADIVRGPEAISAARSLECPEPSTTGSSNDRMKAGSELIRWGIPDAALRFDGESIDPQKSESKRSPLWVDR